MFVSKPLLAEKQEKNKRVDVRHVGLSVEYL